MHQRPSGTPVSALLCLAAMAMLTVVAVSGGAVASHDPAANYTVEPHDRSDRQPGAGNASYTNYFEVAPPDDGSGGYNRTGAFTVAYDAGAFDQCATGNLSTFGVDRGNDDPGRETDERLLEYVEASTYNEQYVVYDFYEGDELAAPEDAPLELAAGDQIVLTATDCIRNPDAADWYRTWGSVNGTTEAGNYGASQLNSHYFYICDCENRSEAEATLGPPPSASDRTATPTGTATATPDETPDETPTPEPTPTAGDEGPVPVDPPEPPELPPGAPAGLGLAGLSVALLARRR